ncbi:MAG: hypothetical protein AAF433_18855, partial [Bacteroidota bacterium]
QQGNSNGEVPQFESRRSVGITIRSLSAQLSTTLWHNVSMTLWPSTIDTKGRAKKLSLQSRINVAFPLIKQV